MKISNQVASLVISIIGFSSATYASDAIGPGDKEARWIVGGGAATATNIYAGEDTFTTVFPNIVFNGEHLFIKQGSVNYSINEWGAFSAGLTMNYDANFLSFESEYKRNAELAGLQERDATIEGGFYINHTSNVGRLNFSFLTDVANKHDGQMASLRYIFDLEAKGWNINPVIGVNWVSDKKVNHYFGVSSAEATATRLSYKGKSSFNVFAGVRGRYEFNDNWDLNLRAGVTRFGSGITDSSIVDEDTAYYSSISLGYSF